jgi:hypothetical protein
MHALRNINTHLKKLSKLSNYILATQAISDLHDADILIQLDPTFYIEVDNGTIHAVCEDYLKLPTDDTPAPIILALVGALREYISIKQINGLFCTDIGDSDINVIIKVPITNAGNLKNASDLVDIYNAFLDKEQTVYKVASGFISNMAQKMFNKQGWGINLDSILNNNSNPNHSEDDSESDDRDED